MHPLTLNLEVELKMLPGCRALAYAEATMQRQRDSEFIEALLSRLSSLRTSIQGAVEMVSAG